VTQLLELFADPDRMRPGPHGHTSRMQGSKPLLDSLRAGPEAAAIDHFSIFVESAVMAPDISKVDTDRHLNLRLPARYFCDKVVRRLFHGNSLSDPKDLLIPFIGTDPEVLVPSCP
jgi:hypothetical protein